MILREKWNNLAQIAAETNNQNMDDEFAKLYNYWGWCFGAAIVWLLLARSPLVWAYPTIFTILSLLTLIIVLPSFLDLFARKLLADRKPKTTLWFIGPAVLIGEVMNLIPGNPFAMGLPDALRLQGLAYLQLEQSEQAETALRRLLPMEESGSDKHLVRHARTMLLLCNALTQQGKLEESEELSNKAIAILEQDNDPRGLANSLCILCATLSKEGKANQAITVGNRALKLLEQMHASDVGDLKLLSIVVNNLAVAYSHAGNAARSEELYRRSLALKLNLFGSESKEVVLGFSNVGYVLLVQGQYPQACEMLERAKGLAVSLGLQQARIWMSVLANCGDVHRALGHFAEAEKEQLEALKLREKRKDDDLHESYYNLGKLYRDTKDFSKAKGYFEKALKISEKRFGEHPKVASILEDYAKLQRAMNFDQEALQMEQHAKVIREKFVTLED
jgi:tetratricopeptide (TPR) repeat protein